MSCETHNILALYQPINFEAIATKEVTKFVAQAKNELAEIENELNFYKSCKLKTTTRGLEGKLNIELIENAIEKIKVFKLSIDALEANLKVNSRGFEGSMKKEFETIKGSILNLRSLCQAQLDTFENQLRNQKSKLKTAQYSKFIAVLEMGQIVSTAVQKINALESRQNPLKASCIHISIELMKGMFKIGQTVLELKLMTEIVKN